MNWMQVEEYLRHDDRAVLPLGSTEQHSHLRLTVDCILPERVAAEAAEPLGVPVFPVLAYGVTPYFREFPGSISLRVETHLHVVRDILDSMAHSGFKRILIVNGHGGNSAVQQYVPEWAADHPDCRVLFHNWWNAPADLGQGAGHRSRGLARLVDGELPLDAPARRHHAGDPAPDDRPRPRARARPGVAARVPGRRQLRRPVPAARRRHCSRSGRWRWRKRAPCSPAPGAARRSGDYRSAQCGVVFHVAMANRLAGSAMSVFQSA